MERREFCRHRRCSQKKTRATALHPFEKSAEFFLCSCKAEPGTELESNQENSYQNRAPSIQTPLAEVGSVHCEGVIPALYQHREAEDKAETLPVFSCPASARAFLWLNVALAGCSVQGNLRLKVEGVQEEGNRAVAPALSCQALGGGSDPRVGLSPSCPGCEELCCTRVFEGGIMWPLAGP